MVTLTPAQNLLIFCLDPLTVKLADFGVSKMLHGGTMCLVALYLYD